MSEISSTPALYIVATPIGNLKDISQRAIETLGQVDEIIAEDTRHSKRLLDHLGINKPMTSLHIYNESGKSYKLIEKLKSGLTAALISDAGTPLISDPGFPLIRLARKENIPIFTIPGPCALIAALCASGIACDKFIFEGFLPAKEKARLNALEHIAREHRTLVFYESPHRLIECLINMEQVFGASRNIVVAKELTKTHETFFSGDIALVIDILKKNEDKIKGEFVIVAEGAPKHQTSEEEVLHLLHLFLEEDISVKQAAHLTAKISGCKKNYAYDLALALT